MLPMYLCPTSSPLLITHSAASGESSQMPSEADVPRGLLFLLSHTMSSTWYPLAEVFSWGAVDYNAEMGVH